MKTVRLWLEPDFEIPRFQRLKSEIVKIPLADVFQKGIHPWACGGYSESLAEKIVDIFNEDILKLPDIKPLGHCADISHLLYAYYDSRDSYLESLLEKISETIYFVDQLTFEELVALAKERLRETWESSIVLQLLKRVCHDFNEMRSFLKRADKNFKISCYADIEAANLAEILNVEDFESHEQALIAEGLQRPNFRTTQFIKCITDEHGCLKATDRIRDFELTANIKIDDDFEKLVYNGQAEGDCVVLQPGLNRCPVKRAKAREIAAEWRTDDAKYCFTTSIEQLGRMLESDSFTIEFPTLDYKRSRDSQTSKAAIEEKRIRIFSIGTYLTEDDSGDRIKKVLRDHNVSMTGRKDQLLEKLAQLAVQIYQDYLPKLDDHFRQNRFINIEEKRNGIGRLFPVLKDLDIGQLILAMYILKHLRGNAILEATHENNTYDLIDLARSIVKRDVAPEGCFMRVQ